MSTIDTSEDTSEKSMRQQRIEYPSGWLYLCQHESVHLIIDALLQVDPKKEFNCCRLSPRPQGATAGSE